MTTLVEQHRNHLCWISRCKSEVPEKPCLERLRVRREDISIQCKKVRSKDKMKTSPDGLFRDIESHCAEDFDSIAHLIAVFMDHTTFIAYLEIQNGIYEFSSCILDAEEPSCFIEIVYIDCSERTGVVRTTQSTLYCYYSICNCYNGIAVDSSSWRKRVLTRPSSIRGELEKKQ